jgi:hypothetical protein
MGEFDYDFSDPGGGAPAPKRARAPVAPKATVTPEQFDAYKADPRTIPEGFKGFTPDQDKALRSAWPILTTPVTPESGPENARISQVSARLDNLLKHGEVVYGTKVSPTTEKAISEHYDWLHAKQHRGEGEGAKLLESLAGSPTDPLDTIKDEKQYRYAHSAVKMLGLLGDATGTGDAGKAVNPYELLTTHLPTSHDSPEDIARKRQEFSAQVEEVAQGLPSQKWRAVVQHTLRARALAAGAPPPVPTATPSAAPQGAQAAPETRGGDTGMGAGEAIGRTFLHGATSLSVPTMAAIAHAITTTHQVPLGDGLTQDVSDDAIGTPVGAGPSYAQTLTATQGAIGDDPAKLAEARGKLGTAGSTASEFAGGLADPTMWMLGPLGKAVGEASRLSPAARALLGHAVTGAAAGGLGAAGEGGDVGKGAALGAATGGVLGAAGESMLNSPPGAKAIKSIVQRFSDEMGGTTGEVAAKEAAVRAAALGSPEMRAVVSGDKRVAEAMAPKLVDARGALLERTGGARLKPMMVAAEKAADAGDAGAVERAHAQFRKIAKSAKTDAARDLATGLDELLTKRELVQATRAGIHEAPSRPAVGRVEQQMELNPSVSTAIPVAGMAAAGNPYAARALAVGGVKALLGRPVRNVKQALAKLYLARQTGDQKLIQQVAEEAVRVGVPLSIATQAGKATGGGETDWTRGAP